MSLDDHRLYGAARMLDTPTVAYLALTRTLMALGSQPPAVGNLIEEDEATYWTPPDGRA
jgi:hypothetical protein